MDAALQRHRSLGLVLSLPHVTGELLGKAGEVSAVHKARADAAPCELLGWLQDPGPGSLFCGFKFLLLLP